MFVLVCTIVKGVKFLEPKADVLKRPLRFRGNFENRCVQFIQFTFSLLSYGYSP